MSTPIIKLILAPIGEAANGPRKARVAPPKVGPMLRVMSYPTDISVTARDISFIEDVAHGGVPGGIIQLEPTSSFKTQPKDQPGTDKANAGGKRQHDGGERDQRQASDHHRSAAVVIGSGSGNDRKEAT
ncbi:hypothetical protein BLM14_26155 (plasmid) [Phyllobacterium zundukense]|nr:hypothetical protein BLM14_26155 [Phyllobacterium zundukense]